MSCLYSIELGILIHCAINGKSKRRKQCVESIVISYNNDHHNHYKPLWEHQICVWSIWYLIPSRNTQFISNWNNYCWTKAWRYYTRTKMQEMMMEKCFFCKSNFITNEKNNSIIYLLFINKVTFEIIVFWLFVSVLCK